MAKVTDGTALTRTHARPGDKSNDALNSKQKKNVKYLNWQKWKCIQAQGYVSMSRVDGKRSDI